MLGAFAGALSGIVDIANEHLVSAFSRSTHIPETWVSVGIVHRAIGDCASWLRVVALFFLMLASYRAAQLIRASDVFQRPLSYLADLLALILLIAIIVFIFDAATPFNVLVGVGAGVVGPLLSVGLGIGFGRLTRAASPAS
jgi:hypothetical protein